jgi:hypothetical protein
MPCPSKALASLVGTAKIFRRQSSQVTDLLAGSRIVHTAWKSLSMGYSFASLSNKSTLRWCNGRESIVEYAHRATPPAATEAFENASGQKYCSVSAEQPSSSKIVSHVGSIDCSKVRWIGGNTLATSAVTSSLGNVLNLLNCGGNKFALASGKHRSGSSVWNSVIWSWSWERTS